MKAFVKHTHVVNTLESPFVTRKRRCFMYLFGKLRIIDAHKRIQQSIYIVDAHLCHVIMLIIKCKS